MGKRINLVLAGDIDKKGRLNAIVDKDFINI